MPKNPMTRRVVRLAAMVVITSVLLGGCSGTSVLNAVTASSSFTLQPDVAYGTLPRQKLDIYTPTATKPPAGWPAVVFFYGGSWNSGARAGAARRDKLHRQRAAGAVSIEA